MQDQSFFNGKAIGLIYHLRPSIGKLFTSTMTYRTSLRRSRWWMYLSVCSNKTTSNNGIHVHHSHQDLKERESIERRKIYSNLGPYLAWNTTCIILDQTITIYCIKSDDIRTLQCQLYLLAILSCDYELLFLLLLVAWGFQFQWIIIKPTLTLTPFKFSLFLL